MNLVSKRTPLISNDPYIRNQIARPNIWPMQLYTVYNLPQ